MKQIILNQIRTPDGTVMTSTEIHDYNTYKDKNGLTYMVDGGTSYLRRNLHEDAPYEEISVYLDDDYDLVRESFTWGSYGKDGKQPLHRIKLKDLEDDHIQAIIDTCSIGGSYIEDLLNREVEYRANIPHL